MVAGTNRNDAPPEEKRHCLCARLCAVNHCTIDTSPFFPGLVIDCFLSFLSFAGRAPILKNFHIHYFPVAMLRFPSFTGTIAGGNFPIDVGLTKARGRALVDMYSEFTHIDVRWRWRPERDAASFVLMTLASFVPLMAGSRLFLFCVHGVRTDLTDREGWRTTVCEVMNRFE